MRQRSRDETKRTDYANQQRGAQESILAFGDQVLVNQVKGNKPLTNSEDTLQGRQ